MIGILFQINWESKILQYTYKYMKIYGNISNMIENTSRVCYSKNNRSGRCFYDERGNEPH